jgi:hypothetical protein
MVKSTTVAELQKFVSKLWQHLYRRESSDKVQ